MIEYDVTAVAEELMLDAAELQEIYEQFFDDAQDLLAVCKQCVNEQKNTDLAQALHNLKGVANNLRMKKIGGLATEFEKLIITGKGAQVEPYLTELHSAIGAMKEYITTFYAK